MSNATNDVCAFLKSCSLKIFKQRSTKDCETAYLSKKVSSNASQDYVNIVTVRSLKMIYSDKFCP